MKFYSFLSSVFLLLYLSYSCHRSWLFDVDLTHELTLIVFLVIGHLGILGCRWFNPLTLDCEGSVKGYTYVLFVSACYRSVLVLEVTHRLAGW
jgi:hypothetical protein